MSQHQIGPWEADHLRTHNGLYWTLLRTHSGWLGGLQRMLTKGGQPRRFGSQEAAEKAAAAENAKVSPK